MTENTNEEATESKPTVYLSSNGLLARTNPAPLQEDYPVPDLGGSVAIHGITTYNERDTIYTEVNALQAQAEKGVFKVKHPATGETYIPKSKHIMAAVFAAYCVTTPRMTSLQWLQLAGTDSSALMEIFTRCMVCSRLVDDKKAGVPDGVDAAKEAFRLDPVYMRFFAFCVNKLARLPSEVLRENPGIRLEEVAAAFGLQDLQAEALEDLDGE